MQIKADVETKAEFVNNLINKIHTSTYTGVEQVLTFVDWLDQQLSTLVRVFIFGTKKIRINLHLYVVCFGALI